jgi:hypothetical protein
MSTADSVSYALIVAMKAVLEVKKSSLELQIYVFEACPSVGPSRRREKTKEPNFGIYHHSTSVASKKVRAVVCVGG